MQNPRPSQSTLLEAITAGGHTPESIGTQVGIDADLIRAGDLEVGHVSTIATALGVPYLDLLRVPA